MHSFPFLHIQQLSLLRHYHYLLLPLHPIPHQRPKRLIKHESGVHDLSRLGRRHREALGRTMSNPPFQALLAIHETIAGKHWIYRQEADLQGALVLVRCGIPQIVVHKRVSRAGGGRLEFELASSVVLALRERQDFRGRRDLCHHRIVLGRIRLDLVLPVATGLRLLLLLLAASPLLLLLERPSFLDGVILPLLVAVFLLRLALK